MDKKFTSTKYKDKVVVDRELLTQLLHQAEVLGQIDLENKTELKESQKKSYEESSDNMSNVPVNITTAQETTEDLIKSTDSTKSKEHLEDEESKAKEHIEDEECIECSNESIRTTNINTYNIWELQSSSQYLINLRENQRERMQRLRCGKPIIYLYPLKEQEIEVSLGCPQKLTCSYPKYEKGWNVIAKPNGELYDLDTKKNLYSLYWEADYSLRKETYSEGFIIKGENIAEFLDEKLEILGLDFRERQECIIYCLPKLEKYNYNYIRFLSRDEIDEYMPLYVSGNPDTIIRIIFEYQGLEEPFEIKEQKLEKQERKGYTVVEWGSSEIF